MKDSTIDLIAGSIGGLASTFICHPIDTIRIRQQVLPHVYTSILSSARLTIKEEGIRGLYKGFSLPAIYTTQLNGVIFLQYFWLERQLRAYYEGISNPKVYFLGGCWAGL